MGKKVFPTSLPSVASPANVDDISHLRRQPKYRIFLHGFERGFLWNICSETILLPNNVSIQMLDLFSETFRRRMICDTSVSFPIRLPVDESPTKSDFPTRIPVGNSPTNFDTHPYVRFFVNMLLYSNIGSRGFVFTDEIQEANVLIESVFSYYSLRTYKQWELSFFFSYKLVLETPEEMVNYFSKYTAIISPFGYEHPACASIMPFVACCPTWKSIRNQPTISRIPPKFCCCIVSNGSFYCRNRIFTELSKYKSVDSLGMFQNNVGRRLSHKVGSMDYINALSQYKFVLCFERAVEGTYITDKIIHVFQSRSIPVYFGASIHKRIFNPNAYVYLEKDSTVEYESIVRRIVYLDKHDSRYLEMVNQPAFHDLDIIDELTEQYGEKAVADQIRETISRVS